MASSKLVHTPATVVAAEGIVLVDAPHGVALSLTPRAARQSARRLMAAAREAAAGSAAK